MSMTCPVCKADARCLDSRGNKGGVTRRRYKCIGKCKSRWSTVEQIVVLDKGRLSRRSGRRKTTNLLKRLEQLAQLKAGATLRQELKSVLGMES
jgi:transcriptional regulator NrdR family protein